MRRAVESWLEEPLAAFVDDARLRVALILEPSGRVLAQHGFTRSVDVQSACALAAASHATATELGKQVDGVPFTSLHYGGSVSQIFLAVLHAPRGILLLLCVFDEGSSLGLVKLYFAELRSRVATASPPAAWHGAALSADFESELNRNLAQLFGRG